MHRVRQWAHTTAQENRFNPWAQKADSIFNGPNAINAANGEGTANGGEPEKDKPKKPLARRIYEPFKVALLHSWVNVLLVFVPVGIAVHFANLNAGAIFGINAVAIVPLAGLLTFATESVAHRLGPTLGALLNVSFGNAVELIIFIIALVKNEIRIVQASLIGSILANLLLILGMAFFIGGLEYQEQFYDSTVTQTSAALLALSVLSLLIPTAFHASFNDVNLADDAVIKVSRGTSVILLVVYVLYLLFQLRSHSYLYQGTPQHIIDERTQPGVLQRLDSTSSSSTSSSSSSSSGEIRKARRKIRSKLGRKRREETEVEQVETEPSAETAESSTDASKGKEKIDGPGSAPTDITGSPQAISSGTAKKPNAGALALRAPPVFRSSTNPNLATSSPTRPNPRRGLSATQLRRMRTSPTDDWRDIPENRATKVRSQAPTNVTEPEIDEPPMSQTASIILLLVSTALVAICAEFLVDSINTLVETSPLSEAFIGLIILPIVGNAAEHVTAVTVAAKNKLDLALGVSLGSSIQIALFVTPIVVILGWILDKDMSLYFNLFETASLFVSTFIVNFLVLDGRSNYLEGALLCACYIIVAVAAYFFPDSQNQSPQTRGPG